MKIVLGGYFETAFVRHVDEIIRPNHNRTAHPYYMCVNRKVPKGFFDRAGTFIVISDQLIITQIDWAMPPNGDGPPELNADRFGVVFAQGDELGGGEWDDDTKALANIILSNNFLSVDSWSHISRVEVSNIMPVTARNEVISKIESIKYGIAHQYLCRILLQVRTASEAQSLLVLSENDIRLVKEIGVFFSQARMPLPYAFPDLTYQIISGDDFASGLVNFSPPDAISLAAVREDPTVKAYASKIKPMLRNLNSEEAQRRLLAAMKEAYEASRKERKVEKIFEVAGWMVKPLHYVPGVGEGLTIAEDIKDLAYKWLDRESRSTEWYLLGAKMTDIAIQEYLARKGNVLIGGI